MSYCFHLTIIIIGIDTIQSWMYRLSNFGIDLLHSMLLIINFFFMCRFLLVVAERNSVYY